jgi:hypothetical protein
MVEEFGCWWAYKKGYFNLLISNDDKYGFTREEAEEIAPQVIETSGRAHDLMRGTYQRVKCKNKEFYVLVDATRGIKLPRLRGGAHGKTLDSSQIIDFEYFGEYS